MQRLLPGRADYTEVPSSWRSDVVAGVTVAVVALPLALAFGITTGLGAQVGLVTAIVAGFVAALFGGSHVQVSGPTGAMTVILVPLVARHGPDAVANVALMSGVLVVLAAYFGLGRYVAFLPWPVVEGFSVGIAVTILLQQVPAALGVARPGGDGAVVAAWRAAGSMTSESLPAIGLVALVAAVMVVGPRLRRTLPSSLLGVAAATAAVEMTHLDVPRIGELPASLPLPSLPSFTPARVSELFGAAVAVAMLCALESLLSARVADSMGDSAPHNPDRELFGQGVANVVSATFGGMPATGAIARTAVNVRAGARSRVAAMVHSGVLLLVVYGGASVVARIPLSALAGVLAVTAVRMVHVPNVRAVWRATRSDAAVMTVTAATTVLFDLVVAVELGIAVAAVFALRQVAKSTTLSAESPSDGTEPQNHDRRNEHIVMYRIDGALFFGAAQRLLAELVAVDDARVVILRIPRSTVLDATGAHAVREVVEVLERRQINVLLKVPGSAHRRMLEAVGVHSGLVGDKHMFSNVADAIAHARAYVARSMPT